MKRNRIVAPNKEHHTAQFEDIILPIKLETIENVLNDSDRNVVLDLNSVFEKEREESKYYNIFGKISVIFNNFYIGYSDYKPLAKRLFLNGDGSDGSYIGYLPYNEFAFSRTDLTHVAPINEEMTDLSSFTGFTFEIKGENEHVQISDKNCNYFNWNIYLTYAAESDENYKMFYTISGETEPFVFHSGDGIPFLVSETESNVKLTALVGHGLSIGEYLMIGNVKFYVNDLGDEYYDSDKFVVLINKTQIPFSFDGFNQKIVTGKRCLNPKNIESISKYYVRKNKTITNFDDILISPLSFETSIWGNERKILFQNISGEKNVLVEKNRPEVLFFNFKEPFLLEDINDNNKLTPKEVFLTFVLKNSNGFFNYPPKVGYSFNFHDTWAEKGFENSETIDGVISGRTFSRNFEDKTYFFVSGSTLPIGSNLIGDFVEYNPMELKERVISPAYHKFSSNVNIFNHNQFSDKYYSGSTSSNLTGYFHQTHYPIKLREMSEHIEFSESLEVDNLPENSKYFESEKKWRWRDLYDHGFIDEHGNGTDFPFLNKTHYVKKNINFFIRNEKLYTSKIKGKFNLNEKLKKNIKTHKPNC